MYLPQLGKPWIRAKHSLHLDWVIFSLHRQASPKKLFTLKKIRTLDLMRIPHRLKPLPLESNFLNFSNMMMEAFHMSDIFWKHYFSNFFHSSLNCILCRIVAPRTSPASFLNLFIAIVSIVLATSFHDCTIFTIIALLLPENSTKETPGWLVVCSVSW